MKGLEEEGGQFSMVNRESYPESSMVRFFIYDLGIGQ